MDPEIHVFPDFNYQAVLDYWCPQLRLDSRETFLPCTIDFLLKHAALYYDKTLLATPGHLNRYNLYTYQLDRDNPSQHLRLDISPHTFDGEPESKLESVPFYGIGYHKQGRLHLQYVFMYCYNGNLPVCCGACKCGAHQADVEHATMIFDEEQDLSKIYFSSHKSSQGEWVDRKDIAMASSHTPIIYVAHNSHANYPAPGTVFRACFAANDEADGNGLVWFPHKVESVTDGTLWNKYVGYLGSPDHCRVPSQNAWYKRETTKTAKSACGLFLRRLCCVCL